MDRERNGKRGSFAGGERWRREFEESIGLHFCVECNEDPTKITFSRIK